jgi:hypothetical protein
MRCSARTCPEFAPIWARDTRRRLFVNLEQLKLSVMFSVTAPGADLYPFDPRFCSHSPSRRCSGAIGCRVAPELAGAFNRQAGTWWSELHRAAKTRADRATGLKGKLATRVWEKQKRGLAHLHGVVSVESPAHAMGGGLRERAARAGSPLRVRLRRRLAQSRPKVLARRSSCRLPVELFHRWPTPQGPDHRERPGRRPSPTCRLRRTRSDPVDRVHDAKPSPRTKALGLAQPLRRPAKSHA